MTTKMNAMNAETIIKAWKDPSFRLTLSDLELADLPENPAGAIELSAAQLSEIRGGARGGTVETHDVFCGTALCKTNFTCSGTLCDPIKW
jgi:mersacidin/lichenicidin family type 2 lantibiotic